MQTRNYVLYHTNGGTSDNVASCKVARKGVITAVKWIRGLISGAGTANCNRDQLSFQSTSLFTQNDCPPHSIISQVCLGQQVTASAYAVSLLDAGLSEPVNVGDTFYIHTKADGSTATSPTSTCIVTVMES